MEIKRFDSIEYQVLKAAHKDGMGYYNDQKRKERYLLMQKEGIVKANPKTNWVQVGWHNTLTEIGKEYFKAFMEKVNKNHGHIWKKDEDGSLDIFAYSIGNHNGYECILCGYGFCHHCQTELDIPKCTTNLKEKMTRIKQLEKEANEIKSTLR